MIKKKKEINRVVYLILVVVFVGWAYVSLSTLQKKLNSEGAIRLEEVIQRAAVSCYSSEGMYPASLDYLVENYGVHVDKEKYHVFYEVVGANIKPEIKVYQR